MQRNERVRGTSREIVESARALRRRQTPAEIRFWDAVRNRGSLPFRVRRQHALGPYVLDFWIAAVRIAIELDGDIHLNEEVAGQDLARSDWLEAQDVLVLRFSNADVLHNLEHILQIISEHSRNRYPRPKKAL